MRRAERCNTKSKSSVFQRETSNAQTLPNAGCQKVLSEMESQFVYTPVLKVSQK